MITPDSQFVPGQTPIVDPLQLQFMTQGQMGYMPQAQFMTPSELGAFRTMPVPDVNGYVPQADSFWQKYLTYTRGGPFGLPAYTFNTYNPAISAVQQQVYAQRNVQDTSAILPGIAANAAIGAALPLAFGFPGAIASMFMPDMAAPLVDRIRESRNIQNMTTAKIMGGPDVDTALGYGFNYRAARSLDKTLRAAAADDSIFKEGDYRELMKLGIEYGQFDYAQNVEQYKRILKNLRNSMTTMMEVVGSTDFKDIMSDLKRMQTMGASASQYNNIARQEQTYARMTGLNHQQMVDTYGQAGALTYQQAGLNAMQGSLQAMANAANVTYMQRAGVIDPVTLARFGGVSGLTQRLTQQGAGVHQRLQDFILPALMNEDMTGLRTDIDIEKVLNDPNSLEKLMQGANRVNTPERMMNYQAHKHEAYTALMERVGGDNIIRAGASQLGRTFGMTGVKGLEMGLNALGMNPEEAAIYRNNLTSDKVAAAAERTQLEAQRKHDEEQEQRYGIYGTVTRLIDTIKNTGGEFMARQFDKVGRFFGGDPDKNAANAAGVMLPVVHNNSQIASGYNSGRGRGLGGATTGTFNANARVGDAMANFESGNAGVLSVSHDDSGGTSYGKWQLATGPGTMQKYLEWMKGRGGKEAEIAQQLINAGDISDVNGKAAQLYKQYAAENPELMEESQRQYILKTHYNPLFNKLSPEMQTKINSSKTLQEILWSTAVQHGEGGGLSVMQKALARNPNASTEELIRNIYDVRRTMFPKLYRNNRRQWESVQRRMGEEADFMVSMLHGEEANAALQRGGVDGLRAAMSQEISALTADAEARGVGYKMGGNDSSTGLIDCSGWGRESITKTMRKINEITGQQVFSEDDIQAVEAGKRDAGAAGIIENVANKTGNLYTNADLTPDKAKAGMFIGLDAAARGSDRFKGIDHIVQTFTDPKTGELMISESYGGSGGKRGVRTRRYEDWYRDYAKRGIKMYGVDITQMANTSKVAPSSGVDEITRQDVQAGIDSGFKTMENLFNQTIKGSPRTVGEMTRYAALQTIADTGNYNTGKYTQDALAKELGISDLEVDRTEMALALRKHRNDVKGMQGFIVDQELTSASANPQMHGFTKALADIIQSKKPGISDEEATNLALKILREHPEVANDLRIGFLQSHTKDELHELRNEGSALLKQAQGTIDNRMVESINDEAKQKLINRQFNGKDPGKEVMDAYLKAASDTTKVRGSNYEQGRYFDKAPAIIQMLTDYRKLQEAGLEGKEAEKAADLRTEMENMLVKWGEEAGFSREQIKKELKNTLDPAQALKNLYTSKGMKLTADQELLINKSAEIAKEAEGGVGAVDTRMHNYRGMDFNRLNSRDLDVVYNANDARNIIVGFGRAGLTDIDKIKNITDAKKVSDAEFNQTLELLEANLGGTRGKAAADYIRQHRGKGSLDTAALFKAMGVSHYGYGNDFVLSQALTASTAGVDAANKDAARQQVLQQQNQDAAGTSTSASGTLTQDANSALAQLPKTLTDLNSTLKRLDDTLQGKVVRPGTAASTSAKGLG